MKVITYSLKGMDHSSDRYYRVVERFSKEVLKEAWEMMDDILRKFELYVVKTEQKPLDTREEYILDLSMLGILWRTYMGQAIRLNKRQGMILQKLGKLRQKGGYIKDIADAVRGVLFKLYFASSYKTKKTKQAIVENDGFYSLENLDKLIIWLVATGEFKQEAKRLQIWAPYFSSLDTEDAAKQIKTCISFAQWFEEQSDEALNVYTEQVENFLQNVHPQYQWREDYVFCGRKKVEYHINMVGAAILNQAYQRSFQNRERKIVLLPGCMRRRFDDQCKAEKVDDALRCTSCTAGCNVRRVTKLGKQKGFEVLVITHESSRFLKEISTPHEVGIVGVACVLNLLAGGWKAKELGIPAQCVLLDACGCKKHWDQDGICTDINMEQLLERLGYTETEVIFHLS
ncbi:MAG: DUF116 domain-containing protein [Bacillota bacterium]